MSMPAQLRSAGARMKVLTLAAGTVVTVVLATTVGAVVAEASGSEPDAGNGPAQSGSGGPSHAAPSARPAGPPPLMVSSITPGNESSGVATDANVTVNYSQPITANTPNPTIRPAVSGTWTRGINSMTFVPTGGWVPYSSERVTVPEGATSTFGGHSTGSESTSTFQVQAGSETRLQQLLAELNYLPFTFEPASGGSGLNSESTTPTAVNTSPVPGTLAWSWPTVPPTLQPLWKQGEANVMDKGAVMAFESDHGMTTDGVAGASVWRALLAAVAQRKLDSQPYDYLVASESLPETLTVYRNGQVIFSSPANTGVGPAATQPGTFPVYARFASQTMTGTDPDGKPYSDPGIPWIAYFNGGDAVHGYVRSSYGFPQSNGCVELPIPAAQQVWGMDPYGTLVTVTP